MARKLAHAGRQDGDSAPVGGSKTRRKDRINRRDFLRAGTVAAFGAFASTSGVASGSTDGSGGQTFATDFEEYLS